MNAPLYPVTVGGLQDDASAAIAWSDKQIQDLDIPVMSQALALQGKIFALADQVGIGPEVRTIVYGIRTYEYATVLAENVVPPAAAAAAGDVLAGVGGAAALGAAGIAAVVLTSIFGGSDDYDPRVQRAQEFAAQISKRLTLQGLADEQDAVAKSSVAIAPGVQAGLMSGSYDELMARAALASKLAAFYRLANQELSGSDRELFVSLSNIGRWDAARKSLQAGVSLDDPFAAAQMPIILSSIVPQLESERLRFERLVAASESHFFWPVALLAVSSVAGFYVLAPVAAFGLGASALRFVKALLPKVRF